MRSAASRQGRLVALSVPILNEAAAMGRSIVLARVLGADELGRAMLLALSLRLVEMASDVAAERMLVVARDGDDKALQANMHGAVFLRGMFMAALLLLLAWPMANGFDGGPAWQSYAILAGVPLLRSLMHLDYRRLERHFSYRRLAFVDGGSALFMIAVTVPLAFWWDDHRAMVGILLAQVGAQVLISHLVAERRYRIRFDRPVLLRVWAFGAPLILNSLLMFVTFQADRMTVAGFFTWSDVAVFSVALQLAMLPAQILGRAAGSVLVPRLRLAHEAGALAPLVHRVMWLYIGVAATFLIGFGLLAGPVIYWIYGTGFEPVPALLWCLGLAAAGRIVRTPISQVAMVLGRTGDPARANLLRAAAVVPGVLVGWFGGALVWLGAAAAAGELAATARGWDLMRRGLTSSAKTGERRG